MLIHNLYNTLYASTHVNTDLVREIDGQWLECVIGCDEQRRHRQRQ